MSMSQRALPLAMVTFAFAAALASAPIGYRFLDEGYILYHSWLITVGKVPYRDFFVVYGPGSFALMAILFYLFGPAAIVGRVSVVVCGSIVALCLYALLRRVVSERTALVCGALALAWGAPVYNTPQPGWYALALLSGAALAAARAVDVNRWKGMLVLCGALVGGAAVVKQSIGLVGLVAFGIVVWSCVPAAGVPASSARRESLRRLGYFLAGFAAPVVAAAVILVAAGAGRAAVESLLVFPFVHRGDMYRPQIPRLSLAGVGAMLIFCFLVACAVLTSLRKMLVRMKPRTQVAAGIGVLCAGALGVLLHPPEGSLADIVSGGAWGLAFWGLPVLAVGLGAAVVQGRLVDSSTRATVLSISAVAGTMFFERGITFDWSHLVFVVPGALALAAWLTEPTGDERPPISVVWARALLAALMFVGALAPQIPAYADLARGRLRSLTGGYSGILARPKERDQIVRVVRWLRQAPPQGRVFVFPADVGLYFAAGRVAAGYYPEFVARPTDRELRAEVGTVAGRKPSVVVVHEQERGGLELDRYASYGRPVLKAALADLVLVDRSGHYVIYATRSLSSRRE